MMNFWMNLFFPYSHIERQYKRQAADDLLRRRIYDELIDDLYILNEIMDINSFGRREFFSSHLKHFQEKYSKNSTWEWENPSFYQYASPELKEMYNDLYNEIWKTLFFK